MTCKKSDNNVRELDNVCLPGQQWTETSVRFDDVGISAFHSCGVVVDLREKDGNDPTFLPATHGSYTTTVHLLTRHGLCGSF
jgi:hypothetical protein